MLPRRLFPPLGDDACAEAAGVKPKPPAAVAARGLTPAARPKQVLEILLTARGHRVAAEWRGMTEAEMVTPGSGQVLVTDIDVPGAGWP